ncbi:MAG: SEFIR domain-containing protein [Polyangiaceae bacterium]
MPAGPLDEDLLVYGADAPEHADMARRLMNDLIGAGVRVAVDLLEKAPAEGWRAWNDARLAEADVVLLFLTAPFAKRVAAAAKGAGRGDAKLGARALAEKPVVVVVVPDEGAPAELPAGVGGALMCSVPRGWRGSWRSCGGTRGARR